MARWLALWLFLLATSAQAAQERSWQLLQTVPRLPNHFTQGLAYAGDTLFESTGRQGQSRLVSYDAATLQMRQQQFLRADVFGEGLTVLNNKVYQCTWTSRELYVYDLAMKLLQTLHIDSDCWGLTTDGQSLVMSNGTATLQFLDPATGAVQRTLAITDSSGQQWDNINELEWVNGEILANLWHRDTVLAIDSNNGQVRGFYNFEKLAPALRQFMPTRDGEQVLNGLAWRADKQTLLLTGKDWPVWFAVRLQLH